MSNEINTSKIEDDTNTCTSTSTRTASTTNHDNNENDENGNIVEDDHEYQRQHLISLYRSRLHISPDEILHPNLSTLRLLSERHLEYLPFENIAMHSYDSSSGSSSSSNKSDYKDENDGDGHDSNQQGNEKKMESNTKQGKIPIPVSTKTIMNLSREGLIQKLLISSHGMHAV